MDVKGGGGGGDGHVRGWGVDGRVMGGGSMDVYRRRCVRGEMGLN